MTDQADGLRQLVRARSGAAAVAEPAHRAEAQNTGAARSLLLTSGKGGVGTSNLALNLAIALGEYGQRVLLVDADLGLANIDLLCGITPKSDLGEVLAGNLPLSDAIANGPADIRIVAGAHGMRQLAETLGNGACRLVAELAELESETDFVLVDAGSGLGPAIGTLAAAADQVVIVTTPEPTSVADAHAVIQRFRSLSSSSPLRVVVNQARSSAEANDVLARLVASSREFLGVAVGPLGAIRGDPRVPLAVRRRQPFLVAYPNSAASRGVRRLARSLIAERQGKPRRTGFFASLNGRWASKLLMR